MLDCVVVLAFLISDTMTAGCEITKYYWISLWKPTPKKWVSDTLLRLSEWKQLI